MPEWNCTDTFLPEAFHGVGDKIAYPGPFRAPGLCAHPLICCKPLQVVIEFHEKGTGIVGYREPPVWLPVDVYAGAWNIHHLIQKVLAWVHPAFLLQDDAF